MKHVIVLAAVLLLSGAAAFAQWTDPIPLPSDSATDSRPVCIGVADSNLVAVWFSRLRSHDCQIRGSIYEDGEWGGMVGFSDPSNLIGSGPAIGMDPGLQRVWIPWYYGSYPVDNDTWGVYAAYGDSSGLFPGTKLFADTGVFDMAMGYNGAFTTGILYSKAEGVGIEMYSSVFYRYRNRDTWTTPEVIVRGSGSPTIIDYIQPCLAGDSGDVFYMSYTRVIQAQPLAYRVFVYQYPDDVVIGEFNGHYPALVHGWHGHLVLACVDDSLNCLVARTYDGTWSDPVTLDTTPLDANSPSLCIDTLGYFWIAYASGDRTSSTIYARYRDQTGWSDPELIDDQGAPGSPYVVKTWANRIWVLWQKDGRIYSAFRTTQPGITSSQQLRPADNSFRVFPAVSNSRFVISCAPVLHKNCGVSVHNAAGQLVRSLDPIGRTRIIWDGTGNQGRQLPSGVYYISLNAGTCRQVEKAILTR